MQFFKKHSPFYNLGILYIVSSIVLRLVLLFHPITQSSFSFGEIVKVFLTGFISDLLVFIVASAFLWLYLLFLSNAKYNKPWGYIIFTLLVGLLLYALSGKSILHEYGGSLPEIGIGFIA